MLKKIYNAIFITYENIIDLHECADLLYNQGKINRSYTLYHFSFEEGGRLFLLLKVLFKYLKGDLGSKELNYGYLKKLGFEKHTSKLDESILKMFATPIFNSAKNDDTKETEYLESLYNEIASNTKKMDDLKNKSIYVCFENNNFINTYKSITIEDVLHIKEVSEIQQININNIIETIKNNGSFEDLKKIFNK